MKAKAQVNEKHLPSTITVSFKEDSHPGLTISKLESVSIAYYV